MVSINYISKEQFKEIKSKLLKKFDFIKVTRNPQMYAMGGFNIRPKEKLFTNEQLDIILQYLKRKQFDTTEQEIFTDEYYGNDKEQFGEFANTRINYQLFNHGIDFIYQFGGLKK